MCGDKLDVHSCNAGLEWAQLDAHEVAGELKAAEVDVVVGGHGSFDLHHCGDGLERENR